MPAPSEVAQRAHRRLSDYLSRHGLKQTRQRDAILESFLDTDGHITSEELYERVRREHPEMGSATVYRTLKLFCEAGIANAHHFRDGVTLYEREGHHHEHLICTDCGAIVEFESELVEQEQDRVAKSRGFDLVGHRHILYGVCVRSDCPRRPEAP
ncbi:MAG: transcriptional repressor [Proteobacteria bacterium]|nr:transcriptional repressor [Pseudomonadota bacterium]